MSKENISQGSLFDGFPSEDGVSIAPDRRVRDELVIFNEMGGYRSREGLQKKANSEKSGTSKDMEVSQRYHDNLDGILFGASRNMRENIKEMRRRFHEAELIEAGFSKEDVERAFVEMFNELEAEYFGKGNKSKRETRKRHLQKEIDSPERSI